MGGRAKKALDERQEEKGSSCGAGGPSTALDNRSDATQVYFHIGRSQSCCWVPYLGVLRHLSGTVKQFKSLLILTITNLDGKQWYGKNFRYKIGPLPRNS